MLRETNSTYAGQRIEAKLRFECESNVDSVFPQSVSGHDGQFNKACLFSAVIDSLRGLFVIAGFGPENIGDERLRVPVVEREPTGLDLHHEPVPREENVVGRWQ